MSKILNNDETVSVQKNRACSRLVTQFNDEKTEERGTCQCGGVEIAIREWEQLY